MQDNTDPAIHLNAAEELHPLMRLVLANPALQERLARIIEPDRFAQEMQAIASENALTLPEEALAQMIAPDPAGMRRWLPAPVVADGWPSPGWLLTAAVPTDDSYEFGWSWTGTAKTDQPFFEDSVRHANFFPFNRAFRTRPSLETLIAGHNAADTVPLSGLIFHMSRCGSTLLGRMLGAMPSNLVVSEPAPLDTIIQWAETSPAPYDEKLEVIRAMVAALGRKRDPNWQRFFVKLDAWHILSHQLLRDAFPDVPWVFLHRDPVEVMMSHAAMPGMQAVPGLLPEALVKIERGHEMPQSEYTATLLARLCEAAIEHLKGGGGMIIDYADLLSAAQDAIPRHFGFHPDSDELATMETASKSDAKAPSITFAADSQSKQAMASVELRALATRTMGDLRKQLKLLSPQFAKK